MAAAGEGQREVRRSVSTSGPRPRKGRSPWASRTSAQVGNKLRATKKAPSL